MKLRLCLLVGSLALGGCSNDAVDEGKVPSDDHGHDHSEDEAHQHGTDRDLGKVELGGMTFEVTAAGEVAPETAWHVHLVHAGGPAPATIRLWFGLETGVGSMKSRASGSGPDFEADVELPEQIDDSMKLWVEVEREGSKYSRAIDVR